MRGQYAPLVFARTAFVDFRPAFLAAPATMPAADREVALAYVHAAMEHADLLRDRERWTIFRAGGFLVAGVVAIGPWLSDEFTHDLQVDADGTTVPRRMLHAFVGAAYPLSPGGGLPSRDQAFYRGLYAETVGPRFFERLSNPEWERATDAAARNIELPRAKAGSKPAPPRDQILIYPSAQDQSLWEAAAAGGGIPSLCTNVPVGASKALALFDIVTRPDAAAIQQEPRPAAREAQRPRRATRAGDPSHDLESWDLDQSKKKDPAVGSSRISWALSGAGLILLLLIGLALAGRKE